MPALHREQEHRAQKQEIAAQAAQLVRDGMSLFLDAATTTVCMVPHLRGYQNLTVVTNSLLITQKLGEQGDSSMRILCTGGQYIPQNMAFGGAGRPAHDCVGAGGFALFFVAGHLA